MIIYFSGTGNSFTIAKNIANELGEELVHMNDATKLESINDTLVGFVFPVYNYDMPPMVEAKIRELELSAAQYTFGVITHGGDRGNALLTLKQLLLEKGSDLHYYNDVLMPVNSRIMYGMVTDKIEERIEKSKEKTQTIASEIKTRSHAKSKISKRYFNAYLRSFAETSVIKNYFTPEVDSELCINCGICQSACPVNNISTVNNKAFIEDNCQQCTTCLHWCPKLAIHYGKRKVRKEQQYHNPEIKLKDILPKK